MNFTKRESVLETAMTFADLATSAYNGAGKLLVDPVNPAISGTSVSVEARHAAMIRRIRGEKEWITGNSRGSLPPQAQAVYDGEENTVQGDIDFRGAGGTPPDAASQTFDEPLTRSQVLAIAGLFIKS